MKNKEFNEIEIGKSIAFIFKDGKGNFSTITTKILKEEDLENLESFYNSKYFVKSFVEEFMNDAIKASNDYIFTITGQPMSNKEVVE